MKTIGKCMFLALTGAVLASSPAWEGKLGIGLDLVPEAQARVGQPLTPVSYAGVARRTTRRNVAASYPPPPPPPQQYSQPPPPPPPPQPY
jgi:hypothetical protein